MTPQQRRRERVADLLRAKVAPREICAVVGVSLKTVYNVRKAVASGKGTIRKSGSGGENKKRTPDFLDALQTKITEDPTKSLRKMANEMNVQPSTVQLAAQKDLGYKSFVRTQRHLLTESLKSKRLVRCKKVMQYLRTRGSTVKVFSDEKIFTVDAVVNRRNDRFLAKSIEEVVGTFHTKHPAQIMVLGVVASDGKKMPPYFFQPGEKVGADAYYKVLRYHVLPWLKTHYPAGNYVWTQDGAPCHTAKKVQQFCKTNFADFWPADFWPPSSPDLNPLDFAVWGVLEKATNKTPHPNLESLKTAIKNEWANMSDTFLIDACKSFRRRIEAVIANNGGHIE